MTKLIALSMSAFLLVQYAPYDPRATKRQLDDIQAQQQRMQQDMRQQQLMRQSNCIMSGNYNCP